VVSAEKKKEEIGTKKLTYLVILSQWSEGLDVLDAPRRCSSEGMKKVGRARELKELG